jgi:hypothetical protein
MDCSVSFDLNEEVSAATFTADFAKLRAYYRCTAQYGIQPQSAPVPTQDLKTDATTKSGQAIVIETAPLKAALRELVCTKSKHQSDAIAILKKRLEALLASSKPMIEKYDGKIDASTPIGNAEKPYYAGDILAQLLTLEASVEKAIRDLESDDFRVLTDDGAKGTNACSEE